MFTNKPRTVIVFPDSYSQVDHLEFLRNENLEFSTFSTVKRPNQQKKILWTHIRNISESELRSFANLRYIVSPTTSCTHLPLGFIEESEITLLSLRNESDFMESIRATPDFTFSVCLSLWHNLQIHSTSRGDYDRPQLQNAKVGIIGFGRVGKRVASYFNAMGCSVNFFDILPRKSTFASLKDLNWLVSNSDILILSASTNDTRSKILSRKVLENCKEGQIIVNTSRGHLLDELAVIDLLLSNRLRSAWLDVLEEEELQQSKKRVSLLELSKVQSLISEGKLNITPHAAGMCAQDLRACEIYLGNKLKNLLDID